MNTGIISMRYARALFEYAVECHAENKIYAAMFKLLAAISGVKDFLHVLQSPALSDEDKTELLCSAIEDCPQEFRRFAALVVKRGRAGELPYMAHSYIALYRKAGNIVAVTLKTAVPLTRELTERLTALIERYKNANVEFENIVDESLIGGFVYEADFVRLDASVSGDLRRIEKKIVDENKRMV